jgi:phage gpG-like protein
MAEQGVEITIEGEKEFQDRLKKAEISLSDMRKYHARLGVNYLKWINKNFRRQGIEKKWERINTESTVFARRKKSTKILQNTGTLRNSFTSKFNEREVRVGTAIKYARVHEEGGKKTYIIRPKRKKTLAFPHARGTAVLKKMALRRGSIRGFFAQEVHHPPLPKRKMLPSRKLAQNIATQTYLKFIKEAFD